MDLKQPWSYRIKQDVCISHAKLLPVIVVRGEFAAGIKSALSVQGYSWKRKKGQIDGAYCFVEPGDRAAPEAEGVVTGFRTRSWQVHLWATVIWCREGREGDGGDGGRYRGWVREKIIKSSFKDAVWREWGTGRQTLSNRSRQCKRE